MSYFSLIKVVARVKDKKKLIQKINKQQINKIKEKAGNAVDKSDPC